MMSDPTTIVLGFMTESGSTMISAAAGPAKLDRRLQGAGA